ncbi:MAG: hypothetical protein Q8O13_01040 [Candidatus Omnitrophota bacterium]|nr:hypothetical protein [Candidatus Omnitrophota bacterium]
MLKKLLGRILLVSVSGLFSIVVIEFLLRFFFAQPLYNFEKGLFQPSIDFDYQLSPNVIKRHSQPEYSYLIEANSFGFRGEEPNFNASNRILLLGDSFGMGQGVSEGKYLSALAEVSFKKRGLDIDIFNTSISGYSTINELKVLKKIAPIYKPKLVILLFNWNDIGFQKSFEVQNGYLVLNAGNKLSAPLREWLNTHSRFYCLVKKAFYLYKSSQNQAGLSFSETPPESLEITSNYLRQMKDFCRSINSKFIFTITARKEKEAQVQEFIRGKQFLINNLKENRVAVYDWEKELPEIGRKELFFPIDGHYNEAGHAYFAKVLERIIEEHL